MRSNGVTIQMKTTEQYLLVVVFVKLNRVVLIYIGLWMKSNKVTDHIKETTVQ